MYKENSRLLITFNLITADVNIFNANLVEAISKAAESSILQTKPSKKVKYKYLPYWNWQCKEATKSRNRARNKMNRSKKLEDTIDYRRLKGIAQHTVKSTAKEYWQNYWNTLDRTTDLGSVWRMAKRTV